MDVSDESKPGMALRSAHCERADDDTADPMAIRHHVCPSQTKSRDASLEAITSS
jgi:hypothetical protein